MNIPLNRTYITALSKACIVIMLCSATTSAHAGNWQYDLALSETAAYESNPELLSNGGEDLYGSVTSPSLSIKGSTPTSTFASRNVITQNLFNESDYDSTDFETANALSTRSEHWEVGAKLRGSYDTTRTSEITTLNQSTKSIRHWGYGISPDISYKPTTQDSISAQTGYNVSRYDSTSYTDFDTYSAKLSWNRKLSEFSTGMLTGSAQRYQTKSGRSQYKDSFGPSIGWEWKASETLTTLLTGGAQTSRYVNYAPGNKNWTWSAVYNGKVTYTGEQNSVSFSVGREQQPYVNGTSSLLTTVAYDQTHKFNELFSGSIGARYMDAERSEATSGANLRSKVSANTGLAYQATQTISLGAQYKYQEQKLTNTPGEQSNNAVFVNLTYRPVF
jgi:hypothetical protein